MSEPLPDTDAPQSIETPARIEEAVAAFEAAWQRGDRPRLETFLSASGGNLDLLCELVHIDLEFRLKAGEAARVEDYFVRFPMLAEQHSQLIELLAAEFTHRRQQEPGISPDTLTDRFHHLADDIRQRCAQLVCDATAPTADARLPQRFGRYTVSGILGQGGFGVVYRGFDTELRREVAIKVQRSQRIASAVDADAYLTEARTVARLDHPGIVPILDVGRTDDGPCYVVSKYVAGGDLSQLIAQGRPSYERAAELLANIAEALHYVHQRGLVHRDIKPGNILLDEKGLPLLTDFGLALGDEDYGHGPMACGTPIYMSPELARGEAHRVDARSDIYSLGVVLYELLTGRRPYRHAKLSELIDEIAEGEVQPPRQLDGRVPSELNRICLKAMAKRAAERYRTARDLADELRAWRGSIGHAFQPDVGQPGARQAGMPDLRIVPKGLRSFDAHDADFFLQLLPDPTDREGLPESVRFWRNRIEQCDAGQTFAVGVIYGPSGSGKSSLVKAGVLPRLAPHVQTVYLEAAPDDTERRLLRALANVAGTLHVPSADRPLPESEGMNLSDAIAGLRRAMRERTDGTWNRGAGIPAPAAKVLIVLDQFEQWLHGQHNPASSDLVRALRQCDAEHVQCLVLVRDDFWMAASRFMQALEIPLVEGENSAAVDLFDVRHARHVLTLFGRALGCLPVEGQLSATADQFIEQAVAELAEDGKVVSVRLSLFADMVKGKPWTPATLAQIGGIKGVGATFLEETFSSATAPPRHRYHQRAACAVLEALLPQGGTDIKGHRRSRNDLLAASGSADRQSEFVELMRILDAELRLVTPADETDVARLDGKGRPFSESIISYQLTHDYLVPSLHEWLARKQRESRRGRAELRLAEREQLWKAKPESRRLPSVLEFANIWLFSEKRKWTETQRQMMRSASRLHAKHAATALAMILLIGLVVQRVISTQYERSLREQIKTAIDAVENNHGTAVPFALRDLEKLPRERVGAALRERFAAAPANRRLGLAYALADYGDVDAAFFAREVATSSADEVDNLVAAFRRTRDDALTAIRAAAGGCDSEEKLRYKARLAVVALHLGDKSLAADMCQIEGRPDPIQRTIFIDEFGDWSGSLSHFGSDGVPGFAARLDEPGLRSGFCLGMGSVAADRVSRDDREEWEPALKDWYQTAADSVTHSASGWTLRRWGSELPEIRASTPQAGDRRWYVNSLGMTMLKIDPGHFVRREEAANAKDHQVTLTEPFFLSDREVSVGDFQRFMDDSACPANEKPQDWSGAGEKASPTPEHPVQKVSWYDALLFCNWLSRFEGRAPYFERLAEKVDHRDGGQYGSWREVAGADGYRLPTEAQWEYACRAGTISDYNAGGWLHPGGDEGLLPKYSVYRTSHTEPCATKLPNGWGLFDTHGNVHEWCQNWYAPYGLLDVRDPLGPASGEKRTVRGGDWVDGARWCTSSFRQGADPSKRSSDRIGFRVAAVAALDGNRRQSGERAAAGTVALPSSSNRTWFVNSIGITMLRIEPGRFLRRDETPDAKDQVVTLTRPFFISDREVSLEQFRKFVDDLACPTEDKPKEWDRPLNALIDAVSHTGECPINTVCWYDAILFCNWLSRREELPCCYERTGEMAALPADQGQRRHIRHEQWREIAGAAGYHLPTEARWEYACRAGTTTAFASGDDEELVRRYAVFSVGHAEPCGAKLPNGWGLFDMHGNMNEWCQDWFAPYSTQDVIDPLGTGSGEDRRVYRGGDWYHGAEPCRSSCRRAQMQNEPATRIEMSGFRVVRGIP